MITLAILFIKSLMFWKYRTTKMTTDNGLVFVALGTREPMLQFQETLLKKHLQHIEEPPAAITS